MSLLPRTTEDFSSAEYWEKFFHRRGERAFEWYGDFNKLCGVLHKYIKLHEKVLVVGCGNSVLSEQMFDVGYKHLTNIDISETVITNMKQRNSGRRPALAFEQVDATQMMYEDASYHVALDKGTLDAMASEKEGTLATKMLTEVGRVLSVGGRYVCVTLAQESIIKLAVEHFVELGWAVRVHCLQDECKNTEDTFILPVFVLVCTKFRQPMSKPILEVCLGDDGAPTRLTHVAEVLFAVKQHRAYSALRKRLRTGTDADANLSLTLCHTKTGLPRYSLTVQDCPPDVKVPRGNQFAIFIVPQGSETSWLYSSCEGRKQLAASANFRRLVVVAMHRNQEYTDMQAVQLELSPMVMELAPPGMPDNHQVPFLSVGGDLGWREEVTRGVSELSGEYCVENVRGEDGSLYRRLVFLSNTALVQSEGRLVPLNTASGHKKNKKKSRTAADSTTSTTVVDSGFLCCAHHEVMVAGLTILGVGLPQNRDMKVSLLVVGLGGGCLPQFLRDFVPGATVQVVELDPTVLEVAKKWFGFQQDDRLCVKIGDGLDHIITMEKQGDTLFDAIMFDVDNKDSTMGLSCPPAAFLEPTILQKVHNLLTPKGIFLLNLVCRNSALRNNMLERVYNVFPNVLSRKIEGEVNEVLLCSLGESSVSADTLSSLKLVAKDLQNSLSSNRTGSNRQPHIDIAELLKDLKVA